MKTVPRPLLEESDAPERLNSHSKGSVPIRSVTVDQVRLSPGGDRERGEVPRGWTGAQRQLGGTAVCSCTAFPKHRVPERSVFRCTQADF